MHMQIFNKKMEVKNGAFKVFRNRVTMTENAENQILWGYKKDVRCIKPLGIQGITHKSVASLTKL